jgi:thioredoxin-like negative regulator of GroEL
MWQFATIVLGIAGILFALYYLTKRQSRRMIDKTLPEAFRSNPIFAASEPVLLYLYSPACAACHRMHEQIRVLQERFGDRVVHFNIADQPDVAQELGVFATPTLYRIEGRKIRAVHVGAASAAQLLSLIS